MKSLGKVVFALFVMLSVSAQARPADLVQQLLGIAKSPAPREAFHAAPLTNETGIFRRVIEDISNPELFRETWVLSGNFHGPSILTATPEFSETGVMTHLRIGLFVRSEGEQIDAVRRKMLTEQGVLTTSGSYRMVGYNYTLENATLDLATVSERRVKQVVGILGNVDRAMIERGALFEVTGK